MIRTNMKLTTFDEMSEMTNREVDCQQFSVKSAIAGFNFREKYEIGRQVSSTSCCSTAPTAHVSEASVTMQVGAAEMGWLSRVACASTSLISWKAVIVSSVQFSCWFGRTLPSIALRGRNMSAQ